MPVELYDEFGRKIKSLKELLEEEDAANGFGPNRPSISSPPEAAQTKHTSAGHRFSQEARVRGGDNRTTKLLKARRVEIARMGAAARWGKK